MAINCNCVPASYQFAIDLSDLEHVIISEYVGTKPFFEKYRTANPETLAYVADYYKLNKRIETLKTSYNQMKQDCEITGRDVYQPSFVVTFDSLIESIDKASQTKQLTEIFDSIHKLQEGILGALELKCKEEVNEPS